MKILIILGALLMWASAIIAGSHEERIAAKTTNRFTLSLILMYFGAILFTLSFTFLTPFPVHTKKCSVKTEIRTKHLNGEEIFRDTVYIFKHK